MTLPPGPIDGFSAADGSGSVTYFLDHLDLSIDGVRNLPEIQWKAASRKDINEGYTDGTLWVRFRMDNQSATPRHLLLEEDFTLVRNIRVIAFAEGTRYLDRSVDRSEIYAKRPIDFENPVLPLLLKPGKTELYVRMESDMDMIAALQIWDPESFSNSASRRELIFGLLYGAVGLIFLYNLLIWFSLRDGAYLFYSLYSLAFLFYFLAYYGQGARYIWGDWPWFELRSVPIVMSVQIGLIASEFFRRFLFIDARQKYMYRIIRGIQIFSLFLLLASIVLPPNQSIGIFPLYAITCIVVMATISVFRWRQGVQGAFFAVVAFIILWLAGIGASLRSLGVLPYDNVTMYGVAFGNVFELLVLSFGLGYRLNQMRQDTALASNRSDALVDLLQGLPYAVVLRDAAGQLLFANSTARSMYGDTIPVWRGDGVHANANANSMRWISMHSRRIKLQSMDAELQLHSDVSGEIQHTLELQERHAATLEAKQVADQERNAQNEFLEAMDLEIRLPMSAVYQSASVLYDLELNTEERELAGILRRSSAHLLGLLKDLADIHRIESGDMTVRATNFSPEELLRNVYSLFAPVAREKDLSLELDIKSLPPAMSQDPLRLSQVIGNLLNNAIKFSEEGTIRLSATTESRLLLVHVIDQGPGIEASKQAFLFRKFEQLGSDTYRKFGGTGLGLAICRGLVEAMGGKIHCDSAPGHGSDFWFSVPYTEADEEKIRAMPSNTTFPGLKVALSLRAGDTSELLEEQLNQLEIETSPLATIQSQPDAIIFDRAEELREWHQISSHGTPALLYWSEADMDAPDINYFARIPFPPSKEQLRDIMASLLWSARK
ncbi:MAG: hypothetical protein KDK33_01075 [Leptospiraceae bacterium]|nr:hypothetical protein [Leptospiraceae bacterium]